MVGHVGPLDLDGAQAIARSAAPQCFEHPAEVTVTRCMRASTKAKPSRRRNTAPSAPDLPGSRPGALPTRLLPQLAETADRMPDSDAYLAEIKLDGYRLSARVSTPGARRQARLLTRKGLDWTHKFPAIARALEQLPVTAAWFEGEACAIGDDGRSSFSALQDDLSRGRTDRVFFFVFDLLHLDGMDVTRVPLVKRKQELERVLAAAPTPLVYCEHVAGNGPAFLRRACEMGLEGVIAKQADAPYRPGRSSLWLKLKCLGREEFVIVGFTDPAGARVGFGALLLGYYTPDGELRFAGRVGTGFSDRTLWALATKLKKLARPTMPLARLPAATGNRYGFGKPFKWSEAHWVQPKLVAEVSYLEWTADGVLRHAVFLGLREDKPARDVVRTPPRADA